MTKRIGSELLLYSICKAVGYAEALWGGAFMSMGFLQSRNFPQMLTWVLGGGAMFMAGIIMVPAMSAELRRMTIAKEDKGYLRRMEIAVFIVLSGPMMILLK
jgi:hypothetical protein